MKVSWKFRYKDITFPRILYTSCSFDRGVAHVAANRDEISLVKSLGVLFWPVVRAKSGKEQARERSQRILVEYLSVTSQLTVESRIDRAKNVLGLG